MAVAAQKLIALLNSHVQGDQEQFLSIALQVAAGEARSGRQKNADELRRFDEVVIYEMPDDKVIRRVVVRYIGSFRPKKIEWSKLIPAAEALSHAEIAQAVDEVTKDAILDRVPTVTTSQLIASLKERQDAKHAIHGSTEG